VTPVLKFFNFYANSNSKGIGEVNLELNDDCKFLTNMPLDITKKNFIPDITEDSMIVGMICGSLLKIKTFDFRPDLILNLSSVPPNMLYQRDVYLVASNAYWKSNITTFTLHTIVTNYSVQSPTVFYLLISVLALSLMFVVSILRQGSKDKNE
jgi:hypothetical protein